MNNYYELVKDKSDEELLNMVYQFDQWNSDMLKTVEGELIKRSIFPADFDSKKQELIEKEEMLHIKGKKASIVGQVIGWITVFGLLGIYIGYNYTYSKVSSKYSGKSYFKYDEDSRKNGSYLFYTGLAVSSLSIFYRIITMY